MVTFNLVDLSACPGGYSLRQPPFPRGRLGHRSSEVPSFTTYPTRSPTWTLKHPLRKYTYIYKSHILYSDWKYDSTLFMSSLDFPSIFGWKYISKIKDPATELFRHTLNPNVKVKVYKWQNLHLGITVTCSLLSSHGVIGTGEEGVFCRRIKKTWNCSWEVNSTRLGGSGEEKTCDPVSRIFLSVRRVYFDTTY